MGLWMFYYRKPADNPRVNEAELAYIEQDNDTAGESAEKKAQVEDSDTAVIPFLKCFRYPQTWAVIFGKFMTDGVWWFFLFWIPAYISDVYGFASDSGTAQLLIFALYALTMLSIYGGKLPTIIMNRTGLNPYFRSVPFAGAIGAAARRVLLLVADRHYRHSGSGASVVVGKYIFGSGGYVSQKHYCYHYRYRRNGWRCKLLPDQFLLGTPV